MGLFITLPATLERGVTMASPRILAVDDEKIAATDLERPLNHLGREVIGLALSRKEALRKLLAASLGPTLMGLRPRGDMAAIETAVEAHRRGRAGALLIPAPVGRAELQHTTVAGLLDHLLRPIEEGVIYTVVRLALHSYRLERTLQRMGERERGLIAALKCIGDAVLTTDAHSCTTFMSPVAVALTGWSEKDALGKNLTEVFNIGNEPAGGVTNSPVTKALRDGAVSLATDRVLVDKDGTQTLVDYIATPIKDIEGNIAGAVVVFRRVTDRAEPTLDMLDEGKRRA
jgi:PAS domain S-box-containing protein